MKRDSRRRLTFPDLSRRQLESASGFALILCTLVALFLANSSWRHEVEAFWELPVGIEVGTFSLRLSLLHWINDGLMTVFFFSVGLEIKREILFGELRGWRRAVLPAAAALGGMVVPATVFLIWQWGEPGVGGWGVPMATDIAFVVGILALLGRRVPRSVKVFLLTLAIVDDIGAVLVIAVVYTSNLAPEYLMLAAIGFALVLAFNRLGVRSYFPYIVLGAGIWLAFLRSGVHPTVAGVLLGAFTPAEPLLPARDLLGIIEGIAGRLRGDEGADSAEIHEHHQRDVDTMTAAARETVAPMHRLESAVQPWVAIAIMPIFALANAGVALELNQALDPLALAVAVALVAGKPLGIVGFSMLAVALRAGRLPPQVTWGLLSGAGCLAGVGFTMSIFIAGLAWSGEMLVAGKNGILAGSALSALLGSGIIFAFALRREAST
ncbi:MAG: Na+/H+ antiporter NhaA [Pirellulales bacterium]